MPTLRLFSTLALAGVLDALLPRFSAARVETTLLPTALLAERIRAGETADVAILMADMIDALVQEGVLRPARTDLAGRHRGPSGRAKAGHHHGRKLRRHDARSALRGAVARRCERRVVRARSAAPWDRG